MIYVLYTQLQHALEGKTSLFENVNIDWLLISDDYIDFSDDDLESVSYPNNYIVCIEE